MRGIRAYSRRRSPSLRIARFPRTTDVNPYQPLLYKHLATLGYSLVPEAEFRLRWLARSRREISVLHFHWRLERCYHEAHSRLPRPVAAVKAGLSAVRFVLTLLVARIFGYRIVWTVHELYRQTAVSKSLERAVGTALAHLADVVFVHDAHAATEVRAQLAVPARRLRIAEHPSFLGVYPAGDGRRLSRRRLRVGEDQIALLYFGSVRSDKRLGLLLEAFASVADPGLVLIIAGGVRDPTCAATCEVAAARDPRIRLALNEVPHASVSDVFAAADAFVSARADGWTSGSLILALSMGLPVIVADCPANHGLIGGDAAGWTFRPEEAASLAAALAAATRNRDQLEVKAAAALQRAHRLPRWPDLALQTANAINSLSHAPAAGARSEPAVNIRQTRLPPEHLRRTRSGQTKMIERLS
jgi:glycosyltransferase involved in cell wall biosynthesis